MRSFLLLLFATAVTGFMPAFVKRKTLAHSDTSRVTSTTLPKAFCPDPYTNSVRTSIPSLVLLKSTAPSSGSAVSNDLDQKLWEAATFGDVEQIKLLLSMGANVHAAQPYPDEGAIPDDTHRPTHPGYTALHLSAMMNHVEAIQALIAAGADPNARTEALTTPMHIAAVHGRLNAVKALAELGGDPKALNEFGADALRMAKLSVGRHKGTIALLEHLTGVSHEPWTDTAITGC